MATSKRLLGALKQYGPAVYLSATVSLLILAKVFFFEGCFAFDSNDDANHTFVNLQAAQMSLRLGLLPEINLYNNFGTPILGDALTFPFSIHSLTYWIFPAHIAMTVNRCAIAFLTMLSLFFFFRLYFGQLSAMVCALLCFFSPGAFWNLAHHHYQMTLLFFTVILNSLGRYERQRPFLFVTGLSIIYIIFFLSVSPQPLIMALPFLMLFLPITKGGTAHRASLLHLIALLAAAIATAPHTFVFFESIAGSIRNGWSPYTGVLPSPRIQLLSLLFPAGEWMYRKVTSHFTIATYFSVATLTFSIVGIAFLLEKPKANTLMLRSIIFMGIVPGVAGFLLQFYGEGLPIVQSVDSTRAWWFSNVFLSLAIGSLLHQPWQRHFPVLSRVVVACTGLALALVFLVPEFDELAPMHKVVLYGSLLGLALFSLASTNKMMFPLSGVTKLLIVTTILAAQIPTISLVLGLGKSACRSNGHWFANVESATFQPHSLLDRMEPGYRMASEEPPRYGSDLKAIFGRVLGSNARAIVSSKTLMEKLKAARLIRQEDNYFFTAPWNTDALEKLGIRYLLLHRRSEELSQQRWNLIAHETLKNRHFFLYENVTKPSLVYLEEHGRRSFIHTYRLLPNGLEIMLPPLNQPTKIVVTFFYGDSWKAWAAGTEITLRPADQGMIEIPVAVNQRKVLLQFNRMSGWALLLSTSIASLLIIFTGCYLGLGKR